MANTRFPNMTVVYPDGGPVTRASSTDTIAINKLEAIDNLRIGASVSSGKGIKIFTLTGTTYTPTLQLVDTDNTSQLNADFYVKVGTGTVVVDGGLSVGKDLFVAGNLRVTGAVVSTTTTNTNISDSFTNFNLGNQSASAVATGLTFVTKAGSSATYIVGADPVNQKITVISSGTITAGHIIQVSGIGGVSDPDDKASWARINGLYQVTAVTANGSYYDLTVSTSPTFGFCNNSINSSSTITYAPIALTGVSTTSTSTTVTLTSGDTTALVRGAIIVGNQFTAGTTIASITNATTFVISQNAATTATLGTATSSSFTGVGIAGTIRLAVWAISDQSANYNYITEGDIAYASVVTTDVTVTNLTSAWRSQKLSLQNAYDGGTTVQLASSKGDLQIKGSTTAGGWVETVIGGSQVNVRGPLALEQGVGLTGHSDGTATSTFVANTIVKLKSNSTWGSPVLSDLDTGAARLVLGVATGSFIRQTATAGTSGTTTLTLTSAADVVANMYISGVGVPDGAYVVSKATNALTLNANLTANFSASEIYYASSSRISGHIKGCTITSGSASVTTATPVGAISDSTNSYAMLVGKYISGPGIAPGTTVVSYTAGTSTLVLSQAALYAASSATLFASPSNGGGVPAIATVKGTRVPLIITGTVGTVGTPVYCDVTATSGLPYYGSMASSYASQNYRLQRIGHLLNSNAITGTTYWVELDIDLVMDVNFT